MPVIGIPRALLYHRYGGLWEVFFRNLGISTVVSTPTSRRTLDEGERLAPDESCLSLKIFLGHVRELAGTCDYILVPRIVNFGRKRSMCVRFASLYDLTKDLFRESGQKFLSYNINVDEYKSEAAAFLTMGTTLGCSLRASKRAYDAACKSSQSQWKERVRRQEQLCRKDGLKILIAAHSYVIGDAYIGRPILDALRSMGAVPIRADLVDRESARKHSRELSPTCKWEMSRELVGGIALRRRQVNGVILIAAFPCGPDAMVNDLLLRRLTDVPVLSLVLDGQNGMAGVETRLESFLDIIRFKEGSL